MKPPRFQYCAPAILDEALALLEQQGDEAKVLAGGQSLIPLLNMRLAGPAYLVDINRISELHYVEPEDGYLAVGATVRQQQIERLSLVQAQHPLLREAVQHIGHMQIRNRGTIVGSIAHADPAAELREPDRGVAQPLAGSTRSLRRGAHGCRRMAARPRHSTGQCHRQCRRSVGGVGRQLGGGRDIRRRRSRMAPRRRLVSELW